MSEQIFDSYDEAHKYSLTIPWKLTTCNTGESCWCRIILPTEKILYKNKVGDTEAVVEFDYIIPDGSIDKETAEYVVNLHNYNIELKQYIKTLQSADEMNSKMLQVSKSFEKRLEALQKLSDLDQELGFQ